MSKNMKIFAFLLAFFICFLNTQLTAKVTGLKYLNDEANLKSTELFSKKDENVDVYRTMEQIIVKKGYPLQTHTVVTEDGYILKMFRIPGEKGSKNFVQKSKVVFLMHGLVDSSSTWVVNVEENSLAFNYANLGFDVWMGNNRGNIYSMSHVTLSNKDKAYWDHSFHELGTKDLPAMIDYITDVTGVPKVSYIGHSQGTAQLFAAMTVLPDYFEAKLNGFVAMAPVARMTKVPSVFLDDATLANLDNVLNWMGVNQILGTNYLSRSIDGYICGVMQFACEALLTALSDKDASATTPEILQVFAGHYPTGSSLKCLRHIAKNIRSGKFQQFDYGKDENIKRYGTPNPPEYDLSKIKNKICLLAGESDLLVDFSDALWLRDQLTSYGLLTLFKSYKEYGHSAYSLAKDARFIKDVISCTDEFNK